MQQLGLFDKPSKSACNPVGPVRYAVKTTDLDGLTIKEQLTKLCHVSCGEYIGAWFAFERLLESKGNDLLEVRDNWIDCPAYLSTKLCEVFQFEQFPINALPMERPQPANPWHITVMQKPDASEHTKARPRDSWVLLGDGNPYTPNPRRFRLGPYQTQFVEGLPLADRAEVVAFMQANPGLSLLVDLASEDKPKRQMPEATKQRIRLLNLMRRCLKKYGMFAEEFARTEVEQRGLPWDDAAWQKAQKPPKASKVKQAKAAKRKTDNDDLMTGAS